MRLIDMEIYIAIAIMSFLIGVLVGEAVGKAEKKEWEMEDNADK